LSISFGGVKIERTTNGESKRGEASLIGSPPPHAKTTSPYYGEGDTGGEVNKQSKMAEEL
jgi:hypothetical protein